MSNSEEDGDKSARLTNPALAALDFLVGEWDMTLSDASFLPDRNQSMAGRVFFEPIEAGGLLPCGRWRRWPDHRWRPG